MISFLLIIAAVIGLLALIGMTYNKPDYKPVFYGAMAVLFLIGVLSS